MCHSEKSQCHVVDFIVTGNELFSSKESQSRKVPLSLRMCLTKFVSCTYGPHDAPPPREYLVVGSGQTLSDIDPMWELLGYPLFHITGKVNACWRPGMIPLAATFSVVSSRRKLTTRRSRCLTLMAYMRSVMLHEPHFWLASRLAQQFVLDCWSRYEEHNMKRWLSPQFQENLRNYMVEARGKPSVPGKIYLPSTVPGCPEVLSRRPPHFGDFGQPPSLCNYDRESLLG